MKLKMSPKEKKYLKRLHRECLSLWSQKIRSVGYCERCGSKTSKLNAAHMLSKENYPEFMYDLHNGIALCGLRCHKYGIHLDGCAFAAYISAVYPDRWQWVLENWKLEKGTRHLWTIDELEGLKKGLSK